MDDFSKALRSGIIGGLFLTLLTPLIVSTSLLFPYITGKAFFFRGVIELTALLWLILIWRLPQYRPRRSALLWSALAFIAVAGLATIFSQNAYASFWSNFERMDGLVSYLHLFVYFLILISVFRTERIWQWFFHGVLVTSLILIGHSLAQIAGWLPISQGRVDATFGNSTYLALYLLFSFFLTTLLAYKNRRLIWARWFYLMAGLLQAFVIYKTTTRGTLLGLATGLVVTMVATLFSRGVGRRMRYLTGGILALFLILTSALWLGRQSDFVNSSPTLSRFAAISATETTTESRLTIWGMAFEGFKEKPILGWGPDNFIIVFNKFYEPKLWKQEPWFDSSHNAFIDWLTLAGGLGLLSYLGLFIISLILLWRSKNMTALERSLLTGLLAAYAVNNLFVFDNLTSYLLFFAVLAYINFKTQPIVPETKTATKVKTGESAGGWWLAGGGVLVFITIFYFVNVKPLSVAQTLIKALSPQTALAARLTGFRQILAAKTFGSAEATQQLWNLSAQVINRAEVSAKDKLTWQNLAAEAYQSVIARYPDDARYYYLYGAYLRATNRPAEAVSIIERALELSPQKQLFLFELAADNVALDKKAAALTVLEEAYQLSPDNPQASDLLINAYVAANRYTELLNLWQKRAAENPNDVQIHFSLAAAYLAAGRRAETITTLEESIKIDPRVEAQARAIIAEIKAGRNPLGN